MVQVELGMELEEQLAHTAQAQGLTLEEYLRRELATKRSVEDHSDSEKQLSTNLSDPEKIARRREAIDRLKSFASDHNLTLGPGLTIKDLINEGRRW